MPKRRRKTDSFVEWKKGDCLFRSSDGSKALRWRHLSGRKKTDGTGAFGETRRYVAIVDERRVRKRVKKKEAGEREGRYDL